MAFDHHFPPPGIENSNLKLLIETCIPVFQLESVLNSISSIYFHLNFVTSLKNSRLRNKARPKSIETLFSNRTQNLDQGLDASYQIANLIAKCAKPHNVGEMFIMPVLSIFARTVLQHKSDSSVKTIALSNDSVRRRIDEMASDVQQQLVNKLQKKIFTFQLDESTVRNSEAFLMAYVHFIDVGDFMEEMLFCEQLNTTTTAADIYGAYKTYMSRWNNPLKNVVSCAADGAPAMMGKQN